MPLSLFDHFFIMTSNKFNAYQSCISETPPPYTISEFKPPIVKMTDDTTTTSSCNFSPPDCDDPNCGIQKSKWEECHLGRCECKKRKLNGDIVSSCDLNFTCMSMSMYTLLSL